MKTNGPAAYRAPFRELEDHEQDNQTDRYPRKGQEFSNRDKAVKDVERYHLRHHLLHWFSAALRLVPSSRP